MALVYGDVIRIVEKDVLDSLNAAWSNITVAGAANRYKAYAMDAADPLAFWLFPKGLLNNNVIVTYAGVPAALTAVGNTLTLSDMYIPAMVDYVVSRALAKESRAGAATLSAAYYNSFLDKIGASRQIVRTVPENNHRPPDNQA